MSFIIRMGLPEMEELWNKLQIEYRIGTISKNDAIIFLDLLEFYSKFAK